jgi:hypothetical protein
MIIEADTKNGNGHIAPMAPIPGSIVKAVCSVQATMAAVAKGEFNKHGGYKFTSTDDIYASTTLKLGEVGLMIYPLELEPTQEIQSTVPVYDKEGNRTGEKQITKLRFRIGYMLATEQDSWFDPRSSRTLVVLHTGPQTFGAAESYCQKAYLRALFKIPTGEKDLDAMPQGDTLQDQLGPERVKRKSSAAGKRDGDDATFKALMVRLEKPSGAIECAEAWNSHSTWLSTAPSRWYTMLLEAYVMSMKGFGVEVDIDAHSQEMLQAAE